MSSNPNSIPSAWYHYLASGSVPPPENTETPEEDKDALTLFTGIVIRLAEVVTDTDIAIDELLSSDWDETLIDRMTRDLMAEAYAKIDEILDESFVGF